MYSFPLPSLPSSLLSPPALSPPGPSSLLPFALPSPLEVGHHSYEVWRSAVSSPSGVWSRAPAEIEFGAF